MKSAMNAALRVGIAAVLLAAHVPLASNVAAQSVTRPDAGLIKEVGVAAYDAAQQIPATDVSGLKLQLLINLATAQAAAGDMAGARGTLGGAREAMAPRHPSAAYVLQLMIRAGDRRPALEALQRLPEASQFGVLGKLAADQLNDGDRAGADETIAMIEALQAKSPQESNYEIALSQVGRALAMQGNAGRARVFADKISSKILRPSLLGEIAKAQHKAGDQQEAEATIRQFREEAEVASGGDPLQVARSIAVAAAEAGNLDLALALVAAVPDKRSQDGLLAQLGGSLARTGKFADARRVADISSDLGSLMLIGEGQQRAGLCDEARATFQATQEALGRTPLQPFERTRETQRVIRGLVGCGFFAEAITASQGLDELNRLTAIRSVIREEVKRGDMQALRVTAPIVLRLTQAAAAPDLPILGDVVTGLAKAGLIDEAKTVLAIMQSNARRRVEWQLFDDLNALRRAQIALGDTDGAARTEKALDETRNKFIDNIAKPGGGGADGRFAKAAELLLRSSTADDPNAELTAVKQAMDALGGDAYAVIPMLDIVGRFSPKMQKAKEVDDAIARGDLASALAIVESMPGGQKDPALSELVKAQLAAGQFKQAFEAASAIRGPMPRATALIDIVRAANPKTP